jgi:lipopolysaccharide transport system permease protein
LNLRNSTTDWTEEIGPKKGWFDINLHELWRYKDLILLFVRRDFVAVYKQTILGPLWLFIQPLFTTAIYFIIFTEIARISTDNIPPVLFYMSGITLWTYFSDCFNKTSNVFVANAGIFGKVYFPRLTIPISVVISNLIKFVIQFSMFVIIFVYYVIHDKVDIKIGYTILLFPAIVFLMAALGLGLGIIFSSLTTKYRDLAFLIQFGVQLLMYATPVIYPLSIASGKLEQIISLNPLTPLFEIFRLAMFGQGTIDGGSFLYCCIFTSVTLFLGIIVFTHVEKTFMDTV